MSKARHGPDEVEYRNLPDHGDRVRSFNGTCRNLFEYTRVQIELDSGPERTAVEIATARIETLQKTIDRIRTLVDDR